MPRFGTVFPRETGVLPPGSARLAGPTRVPLRRFAQHVRESGTRG